MITKFNILLVLALLLFSCKTESDKKNKSAAASTNVVVTDVLALQLHNGEKWLANKETHTGIIRMDSIIKAYNLENNKTHKQLGETLSKQSSYIIEKCSMQGESHDQLHMVLVPMLDAISILKETSSEASALQALKRLDHLMTQYFTHYNRINK